MELKAVVPLLKETWREFQEDEATQMSAALSYYALFSLFPLLLLLVALLGYVLQFWPAARDAQSTILQAVQQNFSPQLAQVLSEALEGVKSQAGTATGIGLVTLLLGASGVFSQLDANFNTIWKVPKDQGKMSIIQRAWQIVSQKLTSFGMVLAVGFLMLISTTLTALTQVLLSGASGILGLAQDSWLAGAAGFITGTLITVGLSTLIFALLFKFLPDTRVAWRDVWLGAVVTSIVWEIAKRLLAIYIGSIGAKSAAYGAIGAVLILVAWIYFSSLVLYLGAEFTYVYANRHGSRKDEPEAVPVAEPIADTSHVGGMPAAQALDYNRSVARATGRGFVVGAAGGAIAALTALVAGAFVAVSSVSKALRR